MSLSAGTLAFGRRVVTGLLGVDVLAREQGGEEYALAVVNMAAQGEFVPGPFAGWHEARDYWKGLQAETTGLSEPDRRVYYADLCASTLSFIRWRHEGLPFREQLAQFLHCEAKPASEEELAAIEQQIHVLLGGMGYEGSLDQRCTAWELACVVPSEEVPTVLQGLMDEAWERTHSSLIPGGIPAPRHDSMRVQPVRGVAYNALCGYLERTIQLNVDPVLTLPSLKHLAVHEGACGHYVQFKMREHMYSTGQAPADVLLSVVNSASSSVFEGIADAGMEMLSWVTTDDDRVQALMNRYRMGVCTVAAWKLHALGEPTDAVHTWLSKHALTGGPGWVANRMKFIASPGRAVLIWSYWHGEPCVAKAWRSVARAQRPQFLRWLYGRMHSISSVQMFSDDQAEGQPSKL
jgi:hypothetical protein